MESSTQQFKTRPTSIDDLPDYAQQGHRLATVNLSDKFVGYPELGRILMDALIEARRAGLSISDDGEIVIPLAADEIEAKVEAAQRSWDYDRDRYLTALDDPAKIEQDYLRRTVDKFAEREGLAPIEWDAAVSA